MATSDLDIRMHRVSRGELSAVQFAGVATVLSLLGLVTIWPTVLNLWNLWTTDALKSIGMVIPPVSLVLILRAWRKLGWQAEGTWWGLAIILITAVTMWVREQAILILVISPHWSTPLPPPALVLLAYGSGLVLLFGGTRLYRAALFPILLLWFANPIPHVFSSLVDLPLQHASAHVARAFARCLGSSLTPDNLRLMFTPDFGMFIAPGCDGIRGSVTMGLVALIAGYVYRFRWYVNAVLVIAAILLGYVFNLARLCLLVLYYAIALHFNSLQDKAKNADYLIGALLFLCATLLLFAAIHGLREKTGSPAVSEGDSDQLPNYAFHGSYTKLISMGLVCAFGCASLIRLHEKFPYSGTAAYSTGERFPAALGNYKLVRSWNETMNDGTMVYAWAQYIPVQGGTSIAIGISPVLGWHDPLMCHFIRGENPLWQGQLVADTAGKIPVDLSSAFYDDGVTRSVEASTVCSGGMCGEYATTRTHFGFIYTRPSSRLLFTDDPEQAIPILLRAETIDMATPSALVRSQLTEDIKVFLGAVRLDDLTRPYGR